MYLCKLFPGQAMFCKLRAKAGMLRSAVFALYPFLRQSDDGKTVVPTDLSEFIFSTTKAVSAFFCKALPERKSAVKII